MGEDRRGLYAAAACLAALCLPGVALAQSPPPDLGPKLPAPMRDMGVRGNPNAPVARGAIGAPGVVIRYEETASNRVIYHEESGGMVATIAQPVKAVRAAPTPAETAPAKAVPAAPVPAPAAAAKK